MPLGVLFRYRRWCQLSKISPNQSVVSGGSGPMRVLHSDQARYYKIPAVEQKAVIGITLIIRAGSTGEQTWTLGAALPELGAI